MELISISGKDMQEAVQALDEEIGELTRLKEILQRSEFGTDMSEETYHSMCETALRNTDTLGKALGERLGYSYVDRSPNHFQYELPNGWKLYVPSSRAHWVEIRMKQYYKKDYRDEFQIHLKDDCLSEVRDKIHHIENGFQNKGIVSRAQCVFWRRYTHNFLGKTAMLLNYIISNPRKHYEKRYEEIYAELKAQEKTLEEQKVTLREELIRGRKEQDMMLDVFSQNLLRWTGVIRVYVNENSGLLGEIKQISDIEKL